MQTVVGQITHKFKYIAGTLVLATFLLTGSIAVLPPQKAEAASSCGTYGLTEDGNTSSCQISDCNQLIALSNGYDNSALARNYRLTNDLNCPGDSQAASIGTITQQFTGTFDGDNHIINNLNIDASSDDAGGLFGATGSADIFDLRMYNTNINRQTNAGTVVGYAMDGTTITNVHVDTSYLTGSSSTAGGLVGKLENSTIEYSSAVSIHVGSGSGTSVGGLAGVVSMDDGSLAVSNSYVSSTELNGETVIEAQDTSGGFIGYLENAEIKNVYAKADITAGDNIGGLVGRMFSSKISNSYSNSDIHTSSVLSGGLVGLVDTDNDTIINSFSTGNYSSMVGGIFGYFDSGYPILTNNFYDQNTGGVNRCHNLTDGTEPGCNGANYPIQSNYWITKTHEPVASWDSFTTWDLTPASGDMPLLFADGERDASTISQGTGSSEDPYRIHDCRELQAADEHLNAAYRIWNNIDCSETRIWNDGVGFSPIGQYNDFTGMMDGNNKTISGLYINMANDTPGEQAGDETNVGLFGVINEGSVSDLNLTNTKIRGYLNVGGIVGTLDAGTLENVSVNLNTEVSDNDCADESYCIWARYGENGGGIVGYATNNSLISDSQSAGPVKGSGVIIGGIVGYASGGTTIDNVQSSSHIDGGTSIGGLVGRLDSATVTNSSATGDILTQNDFMKAGENGGGAIGAAIDSTVTNVSASGRVEGLNNIGGLIGYVDNSSISDSDSIGNRVEGYDFIGGFVGFVAGSDITESNSTVEQVISTGTGGGGFAGRAFCSVEFINDSTSSDVTGSINVGGFTGYDDCEVGDSANYFQVSASGDANGTTSVGGLIGSSLRSIINESKATGNVFGTFDIGGLIGHATGDGRDDETAPMVVTKSYSTGNIIGDSSAAGGIVGTLDGGIISNSYARGDVIDGDQSGGIVGSADATSAVQYSYSTGSVVSDILERGGVVGSWSPGLVVTNAFWDSTVNPNISDNGFGQGLSTLDLQTQSVLQAANFDFDDIWAIFADPNDGYACHQWDTQICSEQGPDGDGDGTTDVVEQNGPNNGDANNDGTQDYLQANVTAFFNDLTNDYTVLETTCNDNYYVLNGGESSEAKDSAYNYPAGLVSFVSRDCGEPGSDVTVRLAYFGNFNISDFTLRKSADPSYSTISTASLSNTTIGSKSAINVTYVVTDGGDLDQDNTADGNISDPVGLGSLVAGSPNTGIL